VGGYEPQFVSMRGDVLATTPPPPPFVLKLLFGRNLMTRQERDFWGERRKEWLYDSWSIAIWPIDIWPTRFYNLIITMFSPKRPSSKT